MDDFEEFHSVCTESNVVSCHSLLVYGFFLYAVIFYWAVVKVGTL